MSDRASTDPTEPTEPEEEPREQPTEDPPLIPASVRNGVVAFLAILALLAFVGMYALVFYLTLRPLNDDNLDPPPGLDSPEILSVTTGLTGLIGGVVAVALAQRQREEEQQQQSPSSGGNNGGNWFTRSRPVGWFFRLSAKSKLATLYVLVYLLFGLGAALVWIIARVETPDTVQALASVTLGLLIPIVRTYFIPGGE
jgi:hypothetical protein